MFCIPLICCAQNIEVFVYDDETMVQLMDANLMLKNDDGVKIGASTNNKGWHYFSDIKLDKYSLKSTFIGYEDYMTEIEIFLDSTYIINCPMKTKSIVIPTLEIISDINHPYQQLSGSASVVDFRTINMISPIGTQEILEHVPGINAFSDDGIGNSRISIGIAKNNEYLLQIKYFTDISKLVNLSFFCN